jgi:hypothetical protein
MRTAPRTRSEISQRSGEALRSLGFSTHANAARLPRADFAQAACSEWPHPGERDGAWAGKPSCARRIKRRLGSDSTAARLAPPEPSFVIYCFWPIAAPTTVSFSANGLHCPLQRTSTGPEGRCNHASRAVRL